MTTFQAFSVLIASQFNTMQSTGKLFKSSLSGQELWDLYLGSFTPENNPVFRDPNSSTHNCNLDNNFIRRYGNIVAVNEDNEIVSIFDINLPKDSEYYDSVKACRKALSKAKIEDVFTETFISLNSLPYESCKKTQETFRLGIAENHKIYSEQEAGKYGVVKAGQVYKFYHFYADLEARFVDMSGASIESIMGSFRDDKNVLKRGLDEISADTLQLVIDLINQGSLLNGDTHKHKVETFLKLKKEYDELSAKEKDNWAWVNSYKLPFAKFKNELIGVLCSELAEGKDLNKSCQDWNKRVDPINYMKAKSPITQKQIDDAQKFVEEHGYEESFQRRFATIDDIDISEIIHAGTQEGSIKTASLFDKVKASTPTRHRRSEFDGVEEVTIEKFMNDILPSCTSVEAFLENRMAGNMVTMTTANNIDSKRIFKWDNNFSWTYNGNLSGKSLLADMVVAKGGRVDGVFRFTHSWNEIEPNKSLMDLHVFMPGNVHKVLNPSDSYGTGRRVGWNRRNDPQSKGVQDVDYVKEAPTGHIPVENITFPDINLMPEGVYTCKVHNWAYRKTGGKGRAEIAFAGQVFKYVYPATKNKEWVTIAEVTLKNGVFTIKHILEPVEEYGQDMWGLKTGEFHKVNLVSLSPNYWGKNSVGDKHYFFMMDKCYSDSSIRSFHNDNLNSDLVQYRKVIDVLADTIKLESTPKQLAGLGFNSTIKDELIVKVQGSFKRVLKIKF